MSGAEALYAYAVIPAGAPAPVAPRHVLPDVGVELVRAGPVAAIVSPVPCSAFTTPCDAEATAARGLGHHAVVAAAAASGPCLPLAYGALFSSATPLLAWLSARAERLSAALSELGSAAEWTAIVEEDSAAHEAFLDTVDAELAALSATRRTAGAGTAYLLSCKLDRLRQSKRAERLGRVLADAAAIVASTARLVERRSSDGCAKLTALVRPESAPDLTEGLRSLASSVSGTGIAVALSGPWPAYAYARSITADA